MGHSLGESAAAYTAGVFTLEQGLYMVAQRGALMQAMPQNGVMIAVRADVDIVLSAIKNCKNGAVGIAAYNGPRSLVLSGKRQAVDAVAQLLKAQRVRVVPLQVSHAFHSEFMMPMVSPFEDFIHKMDLLLPDIPLISTVTGCLVTDEITTAAHWGQGVRQPVRFEQALNAMYDQGIRSFVEIGPHPVLIGMGKKCFPKDADIHWLPILDKNKDNGSTVAQTLESLGNQGVEIDWHTFQADFKQAQVKT